MSENPDYHCTKRRDLNCTQGVINSDELEKQFDNFLASINISEGFKNWALKYLNELNDNEVVERNATIKFLQDAYENCVKRIDNLLTLKISPQNTDGSFLTDEEFKSQKSSLMSEKIKLEERMCNAGKRIDNWLEIAEKAFDFAIHCRSRFATGNIEEKKQILLALGSNLTLKDKILRLDLQKPYCFIEPILKCEPTTSVMVEPAKQGYTTAQMESSWTQNLLVLPLPPDNITISPKLEKSIGNIINVFSNEPEAGIIRQRWLQIKQFSQGQALYAIGQVA